MHILLEAFPAGFQQNRLSRKYLDKTTFSPSRNSRAERRAGSQDVQADGPVHHVPLLLLLRLPEGLRLFANLFIKIIIYFVLCAGISAVCRYTATEIPRPFHPWR